MNLIETASIRTLVLGRISINVPISDNYFIQALLQQTVAHRNKLEWAAKESEGFRAETNGVQLDLDSVATRGGPRIYLTLTRDDKRAFVEEPVNLGFLTEGYHSEAQRELARLLRELFCAATEQCAEREQLSQGGAAREALFRLALFGDSGDGFNRAYQPKPV